MANNTKVYCATYREKGTRNWKRVLCYAESNQEVRDYFAQNKKDCELKSVEDEVILFQSRDNG